MLSETKINVDSSLDGELLAQSTDPRNKPQGFQR